MGEECKGVEIQPMSRERRHGGGQQGRAAVNRSPNSGGIHALIGVIDTALLPKGHSLAWPRYGRAYLFGWENI